MGRSIGCFIDVTASCTESHTEKMEAIDQTQSKVLRVPRRSTRPAALSARIYGNGRSLFFVHLFQLLFIQSLVQDPFNPVKRTCNKANSMAACLCHGRSFEFARFIRRASFLKRHYLHPRFTFLPLFFSSFSSIRSIVAKRPQPCEQTRFRCITRLTRDHWTDRLVSTFFHSMEYFEIRVVVERQLADKYFSLVRIRTNAD